MKTEIMRTENSVAIKFIQDDKEFIMYDVSGNDIHWLSDDDNLEFKIKNQDVIIYDLFLKLYENIIEHDKYGDNKNSPVMGDKIKWYSDEPCAMYNGEEYQEISEIADSVEIIKAEDYINIKFNCAKIKLANEIYKNSGCVRFRRSGCWYGDYFPVYFNQHFYELLNLLEKDEKSVIKAKKLTK